MEVGTMVVVAKIRIAYTAWVETGPQTFETMSVYFPVASLLPAEAVAAVAMVVLAQEDMVDSTVKVAPRVLVPAAVVEPNPAVVPAEEAELLLAQWVKAVTALDMVGAVEVATMAAVVDLMAAVEAVRAIAVEVQ